MKTIVIGIAGGSGSGKTTLAHKLKDALGDDIVLLCHDFYYKAHDDMPFEERQKLNFDHPDAFDTDLLIEDIRALKRRGKHPPPHLLLYRTYPSSPACPG